MPPTNSNSSPNDKVTVPVGDGGVVEPSYLTMLAFGTDVVKFKVTPNESGNNIRRGCVINFIRVQDATFNVTLGAILIGLTPLFTKRPVSGCKIVPGGKREMALGGAGSAVVLTSPKPAWKNEFISMSNTSCSEPMPVPSRNTTRMPLKSITAP